jgi:hypothetical protein
MKDNGPITFTEHHARKLHAARHAIASVVELRMKVVTDDGLSFPTAGVVTRISETCEPLQKYFELE